MRTTSQKGHAKFDTTDPEDIGTTAAGSSGVMADRAHVHALPDNQKLRGLEFIIDGGGSALTDGTLVWLEVPCDCTIERQTTLPDQSGSIVLDLWVCSYSDFDAFSTHPASGDSIVASAPPTISSGTKDQDATLTGWTTSLSAGDIIAAVVNGDATSITKVTLSLKATAS